ncbi:MAG: GIY-YIG nuclease family protein [Anaerolineales bacterium]|nr:MAG: GIY-YIG nuclease family protein [Anaerolineales bacterium]
MGTEHEYYVYILGNGKGALYTGVTNHLVRRLQEHKSKQVPGFTSKYGIDELLFAERFESVQDALAAEKQIKGWTRKKKLELIRAQNPKFRDLSKDWLGS